MHLRIYGILLIFIIVQDSDDMIAILTYLFHHALKIDPSETPVLLGESIFMNKVSREKLVDILFSKFNVPAVYVAKNHVLAAYVSPSFRSSYIETNPYIVDFHMENTRVSLWILALQTCLSLLLLTDTI